MKQLTVQGVSGLRGKIGLPGDKSISHRAVIFGALARGKTIIRNFPFNEDCLATISALRKLGVRIRSRAKDEIEVYGKGLFGLTAAKEAILIKESGTTFRLLLGLLAGQGFSTKLVAGKSLSKRPMRRVTEPLRMMGGTFDSRLKIKDSKPEEFPPISIKGAKLKAIAYKVPVASAQVKSAILLAGLYAKGKTKIIEPLSTRDHTERMLELFKSDIKARRGSVVVSGLKELTSPGKIDIPGDISSAAFFMVACSIVPNSKITIKNLSLNPSRTGVITVLKRMGARIQIKNSKANRLGLEPVGDIVARSSLLKATTVRKNEIPFLIDELPVLMVAASLAKGRTLFKGVQELRVKETDRIRSMSEGLKKMGVKISVRRSGSSRDIAVDGVKQLTGARVRSFGDHRTAMSMVVAGMAASGKTVIDDVSCINKSFPGFLKINKFLSR
jgi:3-phosphoshikimate 1-carboxyvinyltransferase